MMTTRRLLRIELVVTDLARIERFYVEALGFDLERREDAPPAMARVLGADRIRQSVLRRGGQTLVLQEFAPVGAPYPAGATACDLVFQHFALPVADMAAAFSRLARFGAAPISSAGPQHLPQRSGGSTAYKFRDPDGHPLELIQFPDGTQGGIDHSALAVADANRSIGFYGELGLRVGARQVNTGVEQDRLDGLAGAVVDVVALLPEQAPPHVELLGYRSPPGRPAPSLRPRDLAATRLVLEVSGLEQPAVLTKDPDGHMLLLVEPAGLDPDQPAGCN